MPTRNDSLSLGETAVAPGAAPARIRLGSHIRVRDLDEDRVMEFALVSPAEVDPDRGCISPASPIGRALVGRVRGERLAIQVPRGSLRLEVLDVD